MSILSQKAITHPCVLTCSIAGLGAKRQDFDIFVVGASSQQLPTLAPGNTVDGTFVVFVPLEADDWLLDWTGTAEWKSGGRQKR